MAEYFVLVNFKRNSWIIVVFCRVCSCLTVDCDVVDEQNWKKVW